MCMYLRDIKNWGHRIKKLGYVKLCIKLKPKEKCSELGKRGSEFVFGKIDVE